MASSIDDEFDRWAHLARATTETLISLLRSGGSAERTAAARQLQIRGGEAVLDEAVRLCREHEPSLREVGAFVLGQLGTPARPYASETLPVLVGLLTNDPDPGVRSSAAYALGHLG